MKGLREFFRGLRASRHCRGSPRRFAFGGRRVSRRNLRFLWRSASLRSVLIVNAALCRNKLPPFLFPPHFGIVALYAFAPIALYRNEPPHRLIAAQRRRRSGSTGGKRLQLHRRRSATFLKRKQGFPIPVYALSIEIAIALPRGSPYFPTPCQALRS